MPSFPWSFDNLWGTSYIQFIVIMIYLFHLRWKKARLTDKKSQSILWGVVVLLKLVCFNLCWKSDYELGFYSNQFWGLPKLACFHETLRIISVRKSWYYCNSASSNHDLLLRSVIVLRTIISKVSPGLVYNLGLKDVVNTEYLLQMLHI